MIGINTAINPAGQGIGFAIPIDALKDVLPQLVATGRVQRGRLGVLIQPVDAGLAKALGLPQASGALVSDVEPGSPAARAGLEPGDVIVGVEGNSDRGSARPPEADRAAQARREGVDRGPGKEGDADRHGRSTN